MSDKIGKEQRDALINVLTRKKLQYKPHELTYEQGLSKGGNTVNIPSNGLLQAQLRNAVLKNKMKDEVNSIYLQKEGLFDMDLFLTGKRVNENIKEKRNENEFRNTILSSIQEAKKNRDDDRALVKAMMNEKHKKLSYHLFHPSKAHFEEEEFETTKPLRPSRAQLEEEHRQVKQLNEKLTQRARERSIPIPTLPVIQEEATPDIKTLSKEFSTGHKLLSNMNKSELEYEMKKRKLPIEGKPTKYDMRDQIIYHDVKQRYIEREEGKEGKGIKHMTSQQKKALAKAGVYSGIRSKYLRRIIKKK